MSEEWIFNIKGLGTIKTCSQLIDKLSKYRQLEAKTLESGGTLIGSYLNSGGYLFIDNFTPPQKKDNQGRFSYHRSKDHNKLVQQIWKETKYHSTYVGLWHTHPEPLPRPSSKDKTDWFNAMANSQYEGKHLFFFIIGQVQINCWIGTKKLRQNKIKFVGKYKL